MFFLGRLSRRTLVLLVGGLALTASAALAAWILYSGVDGTATGNFGSQSTQAAISISGATIQSALVAGGSSTVAGNVTDDDASSTNHHVDTVTATFTTKDSGGSDDSSTCASHLSFNSTASQVVGQDFSNGASVSRTIGTVALDGSTPTSCAGGTIAMTFSGTTS
jgi:hypothetical protein